jgi:glycosyltransferase involved in cell wall biosynthesis
MMHAPPLRPADTGSGLLIALPLFNDWSALTLLLPRVDAALTAHGLHASVLVVDDGSTDAPPPTFAAGPFQSVSSVSVLRLRRNLGHQRAIAIGLAYIERHMPCEAVIVMDSDGEDAPEDVPRLVEEYRRTRGTTIVFAERRRRAESFIFRVLYYAYRVLHRILTGYGVRVGNFSIIPRPLLSGLVVVSELWNHYAAAVFRSRQPFSTIPASRQKRLTGTSHMNFVSLVVHGLSAVSVYGDRVFVRLIVFASALAALSFVGLVIVGAVRLFADVTVPTWAGIAVGVLTLILLQALMFIASLTFLGLGSRQQAPFVPARDYNLYVASFWTAATRDVVQSHEA